MASKRQWTCISRCWNKITPKPQIYPQNNIPLETKKCKNIFYNCIKNIKFLELNLKKYVQDLHTHRRYLTLTKKYGFGAIKIKFQASTLAKNVKNKVEE